MQDDEQAAVEQLQTGDIGGLDLLIRRYQVPAMRAAYLVCRDLALAEDIMQAAFVRAFERIAQFDASRPFGPWFLRSVVNDAVQASRRRQCSVPLDEANELLSNERPELTAEADELRAVIWAALDELQPQQRAAIVLRYYLGFSESEMAAELGCTSGTVKSRLHRARHHLRCLLAPWLYPVEE